jgi:hypothetical protein
MFLEEARRLTPPFNAYPLRVDLLLTTALNREASLNIDALIYGAVVDIRALLVVVFTVFH